MVRRWVAYLVSAIVLSNLSWASFAQVSQQPAAPRAAPEAAYRINPGDELEVFVWGEERLQRSVLVLPDGTIAFPLVGQVVAAGLLPSEVQRIIATGLQPQFRGPVPQVTVSVSKATGYQFSVVGKVRNPGTFTPGRYVNALEGLAIAGGPTEFAQTGDITVIRKTGGQLIVIPVRLSDALRGQRSVSSAQVPVIQSGDTLVVP